MLLNKIQLHGWIKWFIFTFRIANTACENWAEMQLMSSLMTILLVYLIGSMDACLLEKPGFLLRTAFINPYNGKFNVKLFFSLWGECLSEGKKQGNIESAVDFLVYQAFTATKLMNSNGYFTMNKEEKNTPTMNSTCGSPLIYASNGTEYLRVYTCEITVQNICYDFTALFRFAKM